MIAQLEKRSRDLENELDGEQRRYQSANKDLAKAERKVKELEFQIGEDKKNFDRLNELVEKLQNKLKAQKRQIDEAVRFSSFIRKHIRLAIAVGWSNRYKIQQKIQKRVVHSHFGCRMHRRRASLESWVRIPMEAKAMHP